MPERRVPLRLEIELGGLMVVPDRHPPLLDAVLLALRGERLSTPFAPAALPVATAQASSWPGSDFAWLASAVYVQWVGPATDRYMHRNARPFEALQDAAEHGTTTVDASKGLTKVARTRYAVRQAVAARAWCIGDPEQLQPLLVGLRAIGAHRHHGFGLVRSARWIEDPDATTLAWYRPLPGPHPADPYREERMRSSGRATPPYWDRDLSQEAWWPRRTA